MQVCSQADGNWGPSWEDRALRWVLLDTHKLVLGYCTDKGNTERPWQHLKRLFIYIILENNQVFKEVTEEKLSIEGLYFGFNKSFFEDKGMGHSFRKLHFKLAMTFSQASQGCGIWRNPNEGISTEILFFLVCTFALKEMSLTLFHVLLMECRT